MIKVFVLMIGAMNPITGGMSDVFEVDVYGSKAGCTDALKSHVIAAYEEPEFQKVLDHGDTYFEIDVSKLSGKELGTHTLLGTCSSKKLK